MRTQQTTIRLVAMGIMISVSVGQVMAQQAVAPANVAAPPVRQFLQTTNTDELRNSQVLGIPTSHCGHVIDLLAINRMRRHTGYVGDSEVLLPHLTAGLKPGDLELLCVKLVYEGDECAGPIFQIGMKNNSCVPIGNFKVTIVGVLCQIHVHSPTANVCIPRMEAGEETHIQVQLPATCMCMGPMGQQAAFDTLIVALDSYDDLLECNELNNVQILKRSEICLLTVAAPAPTDVVETSPTVPQTPAPEAPQEKAPSPLDGLDLDKLDLDQAQNLLSKGP
jgi:hypothetical protein